MKHSESKSSPSTSSPDRASADLEQRMAKSLARLRSWQLGQRNAPEPTALSLGTALKRQPSTPRTPIRSPPSLATDIEEPTLFVPYPVSAAPPSRIPLPTSSGRSSISSHGPASRRSSISSHAPMSRRNSNSSVSSSPIGPRSPNLGYRFNTDFSPNRTLDRDPPSRHEREYFYSLAESLVEFTTPERKDVAIQTVSSKDIQDHLDDYLLSLLASLHDKPTNEVANLATVGFVRELLDLKDTAGVVTKVCSLPDTDIQAFLDFLIYLLDKDFLLEGNGADDIKCKARRLALKLLKKRPVMPRSLLLTEIVMKTQNQQVRRGGFAFVLKGELKGTPVALKVLHKVQHNDDFCREAFIWRTFSHEHVLPVLGIHENLSGSFLVSPYMENGTLSEWRKTQKPSIVETQQRILEVAEGIRYIHSEDMVHGDLRGDNVLLDDNLRVKIVDFGLARHCDATATQSWAMSYNFAAPELFGDGDDDGLSSESDSDVQSMKRTFKTDVYAFACLYYEIHFDSIPFKNNYHPQIIQMVTRGQRPPLLPKPELSADAWKLIRRCWRKEPTKRPSMEDVVDSMTSWQSQ